MNFEYVDWEEILQGVEEEFDSVDDAICEYEEMSDEEFAGHEEEYDRLDEQRANLEEKIELLQDLIKKQNELDELLNDYNYLVRLYKSLD